jgi:hypothetical protein
MRLPEIYQCPQISMGMGILAGRRISDLHMRENRSHISQSSRKRDDCCNILFFESRDERLTKKRPETVLVSYNDSDPSTRPCRIGKAPPNREGIRTREPIMKFPYDQTVGYRHGGESGKFRRNIHQLFRKCQSCKEYEMRTIRGIRERESCHILFA